MMDGLDDGPDLLAEDSSAMPDSTNKDLRGETVDLNGASSDLMVDISDALSERDKVKFTVHTKVGYTLFGDTYASNIFNTSFSILIFSSNIYCKKNKENL